MNALDKKLKEIEKNGQINTEGELNLLKTKKAISEYRTLYIIISIVLYVLAFCTSGIYGVSLILCLSTPFITHAAANKKLKKETSELKKQICYYMSFIWKFYVIIFVLLFSLIGVPMVVHGTSKWTDVLVLFTPAIIVLSLPIFIDSRWWKHQYRSALLKSSENNEFKQPLLEETNNKYLNALTAQKEKVKQQIVVTSGKLIQIDEWTCINCGETNPLTAKFCKGCGTWNAAIDKQVKEAVENDS